MSEFLVKGHIPPTMIRGIVVKNSEAQHKVTAMVGDSLLDCKIIVDTKYEYYYRGYD